MYNIISSMYEHQLAKYNIRIISLISKYDVCIISSIQNEWAATSKYDMYNIISSNEWAPISKYNKCIKSSIQMDEEQLANMIRIISSVQTYEHQIVNIIYV